MKITDLLSKESISIGVKASSKDDAINKLVELMYQGGKINDREVYKKGILAREAQGSTGIGEEIAIPHAKNKAVVAPGLASMTLSEGVDYEALDGQPTRLFFMIAAPVDGADVHLEVLARLSTLLMDESFKDELLAAKNADEYLDIIDKKEQEKFADEKVETNQSSSYKVLAVTACPTGIAHTYMAAESLESKGKDMGVSIKVETNGSGGAKNVLTKEEIANADCIIIAADKNVEMGRFDGKKVIKTKVADGIHKPEELINRAISGNATVYHHSGADDSSDSVEKEGIGRQIYKHLMNGVSHMLPFVIGGGILIAIAFLLDDYSIDPSNFGKNTPIAAFIKTIGEQAFNYMLPILAGFIAMSIADRPGLAVGFVGGSIANMGITFNNVSGGVSSGFLGALIAGFAAGYLMLLLKKIFNYLPKSLEGIKPVLLYPFFGILFIGIIIALINPAVGSINDGITNFLVSMGGTSKIILGLILGGMMSVDMGGPVNKAAYVFGTAQLASGQYDIMAAVMAGGMVPPLAIALATTFFKRFYSEKERQSGIVNYVMGLSFISEGAIPFAAAEPLQVIPACIIGSAITGALSMAFGCELMAPHGGIFVIGVIENPFGYLAAIAIGSAIAMFILAFFRIRKVKANKIDVNK